MKYARSIVIGVGAKSVRQEQQEKVPKLMSQIYGTGEQAMRDYDELIKDLREYAELVDRYMWDCPYMIADSMKQAADAIEELLSSAQPDIVHCRECIHGANGRYGCKVYHYKLYEAHYMGADDFCSKGERITDG